MQKHSYIIKITINKTNFISVVRAKQYFYVGHENHS